MSGESLQDSIEKIQNTLNNMKIFTAVPMGILMIIYFFTFAALIDRGYTTLLVIEIVTSFVFVLAFIFLNKWSFQAVKLLYKNRSPYREILRQLTADKIGKPAEQLSKEIQLPKTA